VYGPPTSSQRAVAPVPNINSTRRPPDQFLVTNIVLNKPTVAPCSPPNAVDPDLERRNSCSSNRSSVSPRIPFESEFLPSPLAEQAKAVEPSMSVGNTPLPPGLHAPRKDSTSTSATTELSKLLDISKAASKAPPSPGPNTAQMQSPPFIESYSPKRRTLSCSFPIIEENEGQERRVDRKPEYYVEFLDVDEYSGEDADVEIIPTRRSAIVKITVPQKVNLTRLNRRESSLERDLHDFETAKEAFNVQRVKQLQDSYQRSLEAAMRESPVYKEQRFG
jgi:hypothetical protein